MGTGWINGSFQFYYVEVNKQIGRTELNGIKL